MKQKVLILCTGNSCRSQMAEGVLKHYGKKRYEVFSAGTMPSGLNPSAVKVMKEIGIDISKHRSKYVGDLKVKDFDYIITVCDNAKETCPFIPGNAKRLHWEFPDPPHGREVTEEVLDEFRTVRDMIHEKFKGAGLNGIRE